MWSKTIGGSHKIDSRVTTKLESEFEVSAIVKSMKVSASIEASIGYAFTHSHLTTSRTQTTLTKKDTYTIAGGDDFWICQQVINIDAYGQENVIKIWDSKLFVKGKMC